MEEEARREKKLQDYNKRANDIQLRLRSQMNNLATDSAMSESA